MTSRVCVTRSATGTVLRVLDRELAIGLSDDEARTLLRELMLVTAGRDPQSAEGQWVIGLPSAVNKETTVGVPSYRSFKEVKALQIKGWSQVRDDSGKPIGYLIYFHDERIAPFQVKREVFARYVPSPNDYLVFYPDHYHSISPRKAFEEGYIRI